MNAGSTTPCTSPISSAADIFSCPILTADFNDVGISDAAVVASCLTYATGNILIDGADQSAACQTSSICVSNGNLATISFPILTYAQGYIQVTNTAPGAANTALTSIDLHSLITVIGFIDIANCVSLTSLDLPTLTYVGQYFYLSVNIALATVSTPVLVTIANVDANVYAVEVCNNAGGLDYSAISQAAAGQPCLIGNPCNVQMCPSNMAMP